MGKARLEAFSDGVLAIIITIMVLELKVPHGDDWSALLPMAPKFVAYVLSFIYVGIYWNNHHHLLIAARGTSGSVLWANLHLLFWLSLFPVTTDWLGEHPTVPVPSAVYGLVLLMAAISYYLLQRRIIAADAKKADTQLQRLLGADIKGKVSPLLYLLGVGLAFVSPLAAQLVYAAVALMWLVPDRRLEQVLQGEHHA